MELILLPPEILEFNIFYYLDSYDLLNLSMLNKKYQLRLYPLTCLRKAFPIDCIWPVLKFPIVYRIGEQYVVLPERIQLFTKALLGRFTNINRIEWKFPEIEIEAKLFLNTNIPRTKFINLVVLNDLNEQEIKELSSKKVDKITFSNEIATTKGMPFELIRNVSQAIFNCYLDFDLLKQLPSYLVNSPLKKLCFKNAVIGDRGAILLADILAYTSLEALNIENNGITDSGILAITKQLNQSRLIELDCSYNCCSSEARALVMNRVSQSKLIFLSI
ncbi:hypothetical protein HK103_007635 [Boothiomyces macroporosus]|uniref:F-box domain-containing protein n=1 Tax=Boothiomyces macroporosus TaxID=261099 RepID=A0AAD5UCR0_9FUNG|nr:hypothetical protein HK103_007635 [Boothiomyces macroporosus]